MYGTTCELAHPTDRSDKNCSRTQITSLDHFVLLRSRRSLVIKSTIMLLSICLLINEPGDAGNFDAGESRLATSRTPLRVSSAACLVDITLAVTTETLPLLVGV